MHTANCRFLHRSWSPMCSKTKSPDSPANLNAPHWTLLVQQNDKIHLPKLRCTCADAMSQSKPLSRLGHFPRLRNAPLQTSTEAFAKSGFVRKGRSSVESHSTVYWMRLSKSTESKSVERAETTLKKMLKDNRFEPDVITYFIMFKNLFAALLVY